MISGRLIKVSLAIRSFREFNNSLPQGSCPPPVLDPLLFNVYTAEIPHTVFIKFFTKILPSKFSS